MNGAASIFAQDEKFIPTATEEGMADLTITSIVQDKFGYMWFGTKDGLHRYDGYSFSIFTSDPADSTTISGNVVLCLAVDDDGSIWAGTESNGLNQIDPVSLKVKRFKHDSKNDKSLLSNQIYSLYVDRQNKLWIGTYDKGFCTKEGDKFERFTHDPENKNSVAKGPIWNIMEDSDGIMWISTWGGGLNRFNTKSGEFIHYVHDPSDPLSLADNMVGPTYEDENGDIWLSTWVAGVDRLDKENGIFYHYSKDELPPQQISNNVVWPVLGNGNGKMWIGTYSNGLDLLDPKSGELINYQYDPRFPRKFLHNNIWSLYYDRSGVLWVGTEGGGVMRFGGIKKPFVTFKPVVEGGNKTTSEIIRSVTSDSKGTIWIGTWFNGLLKYNPVTSELKNYFRNEGASNSVGTNQIRALFTDKDDFIWVGSNRQGVSRFDPENETFYDLKHDPNDEHTLSHNNVRTIIQDNAGNIWIGTTAGLNRFNPKTNKVKRFITDNSDANSIPNDQINVVIAGNDNVLWIGSDFGLIKFDLTDEVFTQISKHGDLSHEAIQSLHQGEDGLVWIGTKNGLNIYDPQKDVFSFFKINSINAHNVINSIQEDDQHNLWMGTNFGILKLSKQRQSISYFDQSEGVEILNYSYGASCKTDEGVIYFGGIGGLTSLDPGNIEINRRPPEMLITEINIDGEVFDTDLHHSEIKKLEIEYISNNFSIAYIGFSYLKPEKTRYAYKLEGFEKEWNHVGGERIARYSSVPAGDYIFKVRASNEDGIWSEETHLAIHIPVPYWQKWWFYVLCILGLLLFIYLIIQWRLRKLRNEKKILESRIFNATQDLRTKNKKIERQHEELEETHREITDSIAYAKRIQHAILPPDSVVNQHLKDCFVLYKPKDVVAGDFYWLEHHDDYVLFAAADCTGHGVPGAMVSVVCNNALNRAVREYQLVEPAKILDKVREIVIEEFDQGEEEVKDGMDISLCRLDTKSGELQWAGANNPIWIVRKDASEIEETKADKMPIGKYAKNDPFSNHNIKVNEGDVIYIFTDGYPDQFGGENGKKYKSGKLKNTFLRIAKAPMKEQKEILETEFDSWRGEMEQIDDVCVIGVRF